MKPVLASLCALSLWVGVETPASAAWNNVFQPTLFGRKKPATTAYYYAPPVVVQSSPVVVQSIPVCNTCQSPPAPVVAASPCQSCTTKYEQRCYYQPYTTYESRSYYEPVTSYQTSYYYEPVTTYRYSTYYDGCSCTPTQVATPVTSYQLRAQSNPVQSWVQRCTQVPVTSYKQVCQLEPQTTCCTTTPGTPIPVPYAAQSPVQYQQPQQPAYNPNPAPPQFKDSYQPQQQAPQGPNMSGTYTPQSSNWHGTTSQGKLPPNVVLERPTPNGTVVDGQVVRNDNSPRSGASLMFMNAKSMQRFTVTANTNGRFHTDLPAGAYHVYMQNGDGTTSFYSTIEVQDQRPTVLMVKR